MTHTPQDCQSIFVSWRWLIAVLVTLIVTVATVAYQGGSKLSTMETSIQTLKTDVDQLKKISRDLDSIKIWTRQ